MKNLFVLSALLGVSLCANASELPSPSVKVLPQSYGWFDAFAVTWEESPGHPYSLQILDPKAISVVKNKIEDIGIIDVQTVEYQADDNSPNYQNARLVITLSMIEFEIGAQYTLTLPEGCVNILINDSEKLVNDEFEYTFTLNADENVTMLPDPDIKPLPGEVEELSWVKLSWMGVLGSFDLLNEVNQVNPSAHVSPVTLTSENGMVSYPEVNFEWSSRQAVTEGSAGDIFVISLTDEGSLAPGNYLITIPEGYLQITDIETGTLFNEKIEFGYTVINGPYDSIETIESSGKTTEIYNIKGTKLNVNDIDHLPGGIYIINGKKVIK